MDNIIGGVPSDVLGMLGDLCSKLKHGSITLEELESFVNRRNPFENRRTVLAQWEALYRGLGVVVDLGGVRIPAKRRGFDRLIVVPQGIKIQRAYEACASTFPCWKWAEEDLDAVVSENDRDPNRDGTYAIWLRERVEADEEWKNKSANQLRGCKIPGATLLERLLYELKFFKETGRHLDIKNVTLCAGSRCRDGHVPFVHFSEFDGEVRVFWSFPGDAFGSLRSREVVS
ncbi:MAG: hypothetical protein AAB792_00905 [Patescibacteria group bacterium]